MQGMASLTELCIKHKNKIPQGTSDEHEHPILPFAHRKPSFETFEENGFP
jgi:hypothetical protein